MKKIIMFLACLQLPWASRARADWRFTDRSSAQIAPLPENESSAVVQIYAARAASWRGYFAVHCWIATKEKGAADYFVYDVNGFRKWYGRKVVLVQKDIPDRRWYGNEPELLFELRGPEAEKMIPKIQANAEAYPYQNDYRVWPGPNSNTFISFIMRRTPGIYVELPPNALGKDWIEEGALWGVTESGTGAQLSLFGLLGVSVGLAEGIEMNILGMTFGIDFYRPALKFPFLGRVGFPDAPVFNTTSPTATTPSPIIEVSPTRSRELETKKSG
jgi:hypothetical protein